MGNIIGFIVWGLIIGAVARLIKPGRQNLSIPATLGLGLVGSVIGGLLASLIGKGSIFELDFLGFVFALMVSVLLIGTAEAVTGGRKQRSSPDGSVQQPSRSTSSTQQTQNSLPSGSRRTT